MPMKRDHQESLNDKGRDIHLQNSTYMFVTDRWQCTTGISTSGKILQGNCFETITLTLLHIFERVLLSKFLYDYGDVLLFAIVL